MRTKYLLKNKGVFTQHPDGLNGWNRSEVILWRAVLDQSLRDACSTSKSNPQDEIDRNEALQWFHATPGSVRTYKEKEEDGGREYTVDDHQEFEEVCSRANLDPSFVRKVWLETYRRVLRDE